MYFFYFDAFFHFSGRLVEKCVCVFDSFGCKNKVFLLSVLTPILIYSPLDKLSDLFLKNTPRRRPKTAPHILSCHAGCLLIQFDR